MVFGLSLGLPPFTARAPAALLDKLGTLVFAMLAPAVPAKPSTLVFEVRARSAVLAKPCTRLFAVLLVCRDALAGLRGVLLRELVLFRGSLRVSTDLPVPVRVLSAFLARLLPPTLLMPALPLVALPLVALPLIALPLLTLLLLTLSLLVFLRFALPVLALLLFALTLLLLLLLALLLLALLLTLLLLALLLFALPLRTLPPLFTLGLPTLPLLQITTAPYNYSLRVRC
jgi:hypothetical protein